MHSVLRFMTFSKLSAHVFFGLQAVDRNIPKELHMCSMYDLLTYPQHNGYCEGVVKNQDANVN
jgi:hypothetical protein